MLKVLIADSRTDNTVQRNLGGGRYAPAVDHIVADFDRVEYGGPIYCYPYTLPTLPKDLAEAAGYGDDEEAILRDAVFSTLTQNVPDDRGGWAQSVNALTRTGFKNYVDSGPELSPNYKGVGDHDAGPEFAAWWVKCYRGDEAPITIIHDARAFLCDDKGRTVEHLGPRDA